MDNTSVKDIDSHLQEWLNALTVNECNALQNWLKRRVKYLNSIPFIQRKIEELSLSPRAYNALKSNKLHTVGDIVRFGVDNIWKIRNIGAKTVNEIQLAMIS